MTNLLEKALLTGFGVFILVLFFSFINPFLMQISEVKEYYGSEVIPYLKLIDEIDDGISYIQKNRDDQILKTIDYPNRMNISFYNYKAIFEYYVDSRIESIIFEYTDAFFNHSYILLTPRQYVLNISLHNNLINVLFY